MSAPLPDHPEIVIVRANLYYVLSRAFSSPSIMNEEDPKQLRAIAENLPATAKRHGYTLEELWRVSLGDVQPLIRSYCRLFLGPLEILAPPYASYYMEENHQLMGPVSQAVAEEYADSGLKPGPGPREAPDHVAMELEYLYFLAHQHLVTGEKTWRDREETFIERHFRVWVPDMLKAIEQSKEHPFYDALTRLVSSVLREQTLL